MPILNVRTLAYFDKPVYRYLIGREGQSVSSEVFKKSLAVRYFVYSALVDSYCLLYTSKCVRILYLQFPIIRLLSVDFPRLAL